MAYLLLKLKLAYLVFVCVTTLPHAASVSFNYNFSTPGALTSPELMYISNTTATGDRIYLTKETAWSTGRVAYGLPVQLWENSTGKVASFTSNFTFVIEGPKGRPKGVNGSRLKFLTIGKISLVPSVHPNP